MKTIAGQVVRQLDAGLPAETKDRRWLETAVRVLNHKLAGEITEDHGVAAVLAITSKERPSQIHGP